jgi:hypothetical protein
VTTSVGLSRTPFLVTVSPRVCSCRGPEMELSRHRTPRAAIAVAAGYYTVWEAFFPQQTYWLDWRVVDRRDGRLIWHNGTDLSEGSTHGKDSVQSGQSSNW